MPFTRVKFDKHRHKKEKWTTTGIIKSIKYRDKLERSTCKHTRIYNHKMQYQNL